MKEYVGQLSEILQTNPRGTGGPSHGGLVILRGNNVEKEDFDEIARTLLGARFGGKKAVAACFRAAGLVTARYRWNLTWRDDFSLGAYLIGCMNIAGYYRPYLDFERGTQPEYWLEVKDNGILEFPETDQPIQYQPDLDWVDRKVGIGNRLVKPSHPQLKETVWNPFSLSEAGDYASATLSTHAGRMPWMHNYLDDRRRGHSNREWWQATIRLSKTAFEVNPKILALAITIDQDCDRRLPEDIDGFVERKNALEQRRVEENIAELKKKDRKELTEPEKKILDQFLNNFHDLMNLHRSVLGKRRAFERTIDKAKEVGTRIFYNQVFADYRGRLYFKDTGLSYQGGDLQRAMVQFPEGKVIKATDWKFLWLQIANTWGLKGVWEQRVADAKSMQSDVLRYAKSPVETYDEWSQAPDKWQFIRTCFEIHALLDDPCYSSHLICEIDQSTSCLQHMALVMGDVDMMKKVNLGPDYSDIYQIIGDSLKLKADVSSEHRRKIAKSALVPFGYGSGVKKIAQEYDELDLPYLNTISSKDRWDLAKMVVEKIEQILPTAKDYKNLMKQKAADLIKQGMNEFVWDSSSGFEVHHYKQKPVSDSKTFRPIFYLGNGEKARLQAIEPSAVADKERLKSGLPPNFIHSIDSAVLHFVVADSDIPIAVVHDAYGVRVADASQLNQLFYDKLLYVYDAHNPMLLFDSSIGEIDPDADPIRQSELTPVPYPFHKNISDEARALIKNSQHALT